MFALEMVVLPAGPSPRTWGLRHCRHISVVLVRSIPTHVGFTQDGRAVAASVAVHPHARGVYITLNGAVGNYTGPSPRTWGLRICILPTPRWFRSIPTHVGFTLNTTPPRSGTAVHPHARGVYDQKTGSKRNALGPSPRTWGLRGAFLYIPYLRRSIPTHVGFTASWAMVAPSLAGPSPRTWGLRKRERKRRGTPSGPSPRTWGLLR